MCVEGCQKAVQDALSRRGFLKSAAGMTAGGLATVAATSSVHASEPASFSKVVDLTHTLNKEFPTFGGTQDYFELEELFNVKKDGYQMYKWHLTEHVGTHMDAPAHFSAEGATNEVISADQLVVPLAVIDVVESAKANPDYQVSVADIEAWEEPNGQLPEGCCVAMNSGWAAFVGTDKFRNADAEGGMHFPGFSKEAAEFLRDKRVVMGIAVDTLSLDHGASKDFGAHVAWLLSDRWGLECVANLDSMPAKGATLVVGAQKIESATGGPSRILALI